jgi:uncharacterized membrane protein
MILILLRIHFLINDYLRNLHLRINLEQNRNIIKISILQLMIKFIILFNKQKN